MDGWMETTAPTWFGACQPSHFLFQLSLKVERMYDPTFKKHFILTSLWSLVIICYLRTWDWCAVWFFFSSLVELPSVICLKHDLRMRFNNTLISLLMAIETKKIYIHYFKILEYLHGLHFIILINFNHLLKPITNLTKSPVLSKYCFFFPMSSTGFIALHSAHVFQYLSMAYATYILLHRLCNVDMFYSWGHVFKMIFFYQYSITLHSVLVPVMNPLLFSFQGHLSCELRLWAYNHLHFLTVFKDSLYIQETFGWTAGPYQDP